MNVASARLERVLVRGPLIIGSMIAVGVVGAAIRSFLPSSLPGPDAAAEMAGYFLVPFAFAVLLAIAFAVTVATKWSTLSGPARRNGLIPIGVAAVLLVLLEVLGGL